MGSIFFQKSVAMVWVPLFMFIVGGVFYVVISGYNPKTAVVESIEDVIEFETGMEFDFNDFEPSTEKEMAELSLRDRFLTEVFPGEYYNPR